MIAKEKYIFGSFGRVCTRCVMDESVPDIWFDNVGECNYCKMHDRLCEDNPNDDRGAEKLKGLIARLKEEGKSRAYDVAIGVSGGTDSTYLLHLAKENELRVLAVHLDNGWNTEVSSANLYNALEAMDIDLYTHVIDWREFRGILRSQLLSGLPWADSPTDLAITSLIYQVADRFGIRNIFIGHCFRTEGRQPNAWTHADIRQLRHIHRKFGSGTMRTYPTQTPFQLIYYALVRRIVMHRPFYHIRYDKSAAKKLISARYGWKDYGGHHHENIFTRYIIGVWMPLKFGMDKRKVTLSAYVRNGEMTRDIALATLKLPSYDPDLMKEDHIYVGKKLGFTPAEMGALWMADNRSFLDYPSYYHFFERFKGLSTSVFRHILPFRPMMSYDMKKPG